MIEAINLTKRFNDLVAVNKLSLNVNSGDVFGLLGPNAAGKTTTIRLLCGIIKSDDGEARINGMRVNEAKADFGYVAQHFGQYDELSVWENLTFYAQMYNVTDEKRLSYLLERYGLEPFKTQIAGSLSGGFQRRLALSCALAHDPKVLFLDEPTAGIDPVTRKLLWDDFYKLSAEGKTLFITTHYMEEAQRCNQLAFISSGKLVAEGTPDSIKQSLGDVDVYTTRIPYLPELQNKLMDLQGMVLLNQLGNELHLVVKPELVQSNLESVITSITGKSCSLMRSEPNLEDVFISLTLDGLSNK